ncbi:MAG: TM2 domain-containing protein [Niabella sp.]
MNPNNILMMFPDMNAEELHSIQALMQGMSETQQQNFLSVYKSKRRDRTLMLVLAIIGFFGPAGIHRFLSGDIGLGILYLLTIGLCFIGTIVDIVNINSITLKYNLSQATEAANMVRMLSQHPQQQNF